MNPADQNPLNQTLAAQMTLLEQHDNTLKALMEHMKEFSISLASLRTQVTDFNTKSSTSTAAQSPAASQAQPPPTREAFVPPPAPYSGDLGTCKSFLTQCSLIFEQQPLTYANDRAKICYLIGCLRGHALNWASAIWEKQGEVCFSYPDFTAEMKQIFDHPVSGKEAAKRLFSLRQGTRSVAEFAIEFRTLAAESGWNNEALHGAFLHALSDSLKDEMASRDVPSDLSDLIDLSIRVDNRLRERRRERAGKASTLRSLNVPSSSPPAVFPALPPPPQSTAEPEPMQLGRARLDAEERQRRLDTRSCLYCGQFGHFISTCPVRPAKGAAQQ